MTDIWLYTADRWGVERADAYVRRIESKIARALRLPGSGSPVTGLPPAYRKLRAGSHRIIYRHAGDELVVVRVLHERQDVPDEIMDFW
jgi:toxin ParE1/3/4